ncbi:MAG: hypothetical protein IJP77_09235 [Bacteroidales bacterium]|nr:hypothetical protein [Bacteroidales bacterium]
MSNMNVGASLPEDYGGYYAWGETSEKTGSSAYSYNEYVYGPYDFEQFTDYGLAKNITTQMV